jgi:hypothetical protein
VAYQTDPAPLTDQFVSRACGLIGKWENKLFPLCTVLLTFEISSLPVYERVPVCLCIPNPMQGYQCQKCGHIPQSCASNVGCGPKHQYPPRLRSAPRLKTYNPPPLDVRQPWNNSLKSPVKNPCQSGLGQGHGRSCATRSVYPTIVSLP